MRAHRATSPEVPNFLHYYKEGMPFSRYLEVLAEQERGVNLPRNHVPSTFLFGFVGPRIVVSASALPGTASDVPRIDRVNAVGRGLDLQGDERVGIRAVRDQPCRKPSWARTPRW